MALVALVALGLVVASCTTAARTPPHAAEASGPPSPAPAFSLPAPTPPCLSTVELEDATDGAIFGLRQAVRAFAASEPRSAVRPLYLAQDALRAAAAVASADAALSGELSLAAAAAADAAAATVARDYGAVPQQISRAVAYIRSAATLAEATTVPPCRTG